MRERRLWLPERLVSPRRERRLSSGSTARRTQVASVANIDLSVRRLPLIQVARLGTLVGGSGAV